MTTTYDPKTTAVLCIDLYNDFLSEGGKLWPWVKDVAEEVGLLDNLRTVVRRALVQIVGASQHSLLRHADFRPEAPRSRLQVQLGLGHPNVLV
jgi:nicotinamidase-related amidase